MTNPQTLGIIRHILTLLGGMLVALNWLPQEVVDTLTGAIIGIAGGVIAIIGIIASIRAKEKQPLNQ